MKTIFCTLRFHTSDAVIFEDYLNSIFLPLLKPHLLIGAIEHDNTLQRHFHGVINLDSFKMRDRDKLRQKLYAPLTKYLSKIHNQTEVQRELRFKSLQLSNILTDNFLDTKGKNCIGYCLKSNNLSRVWGTLPDEDRELHKNIYLNSLKINRKSLSKLISLIPVVNKTGFTLCYEFLYTKYSKLYLSNIKNVFVDMMISRNFDLTNLTKYVKQQIILQLEIFAKSENNEEISDQKLATYRQRAIDGTADADAEAIYKYEKIKDHIYLLEHDFLQEKNSETIQFLQHIIHS